MSQGGEGAANPPKGGSLSLARDSVELLDAQVRVTADLVEASEKGLTATKALAKEIQSLNQGVQALKDTLDVVAEMLAEVLDNMEDPEDDGGEEG